MPSHPHVPVVLYCTAEKQGGITSKQWSPRRVAFYPDRMDIFYTNILSSNSDIGWKKRIKVQNIRFEAERYYAPDYRRPDFDENRLYIVHIIGPEKSMKVSGSNVFRDDDEIREKSDKKKSKEDGKPVSKTGSGGVMSFEYKRGVAHNRSSSEKMDGLSDGIGTGAKGSGSTADNLMSMGARNKKKSGSQQVTTFRARNYDDLMQFFVRIRARLEQTGRFANHLFGEARTVVDPRNGLELKSVPLNVKATLHEFDDAVMYFMHRGCMMDTILVDPVANPALMRASESLTMPASAESLGSSSNSFNATVDSSFSTGNHGANESVDSTSSTTAKKSKSGISSFWDKTGGRMVSKVSSVGASTGSREHSESRVTERIVRRRCYLVLTHDHILCMQHERKSGKPMAALRGLALSNISAIVFSISHNQNAPVNVNSTRKSQLKAMKTTPSATWMKSVRTYDDAARAEGGPNSSSAFRSETLSHPVEAFVMLIPKDTPSTPHMIYSPLPNWIPKCWRGPPYNMCESGFLPAVIVEKLVLRLYAVFEELSRTSRGAIGMPCFVNVSDDTVGVAALGSAGSKSESTTENGSSIPIVTFLKTSGLLSSVEWGNRVAGVDSVLSNKTLTDADKMKKTSKSKMSAEEEERRRGSSDKFDAIRRDKHKMKYTVHLEKKGELGEWLRTRSADLISSKAYAPPTQDLQDGYSSSSSSNYHPRVIDQITGSGRRVPARPPISREHGRDLDDMSDAYSLSSAAGSSHYSPSSSAAATAASSGIQQSRNHVDPASPLDGSMHDSLMDSGVDVFPVKRKLKLNASPSKRAPGGTPEPKAGGARDLDRSVEFNDESLDFDDEFNDSESTGSDADTFEDSIRLDDSLRLTSALDSSVRRDRLASVMLAKTLNRILGSPTGSSESSSRSSSVGKPSGTTGKGNEKKPQRGGSSAAGATAGVNGGNGNDSDDDDDDVDIDRLIDNQFDDDDFVPSNAKKPNPSASSAKSKHHQDNGAYSDGSDDDHDGLDDTLDLILDDDDL